MSKQFPHQNNYMFGRCAEIVYVPKVLLLQQKISHHTVKKEEYVIFYPLLYLDVKVSLIVFKLSYCKCMQYSFCSAHFLYIFVVTSIRHVYLV